jgi:hypothetical protein
VHVFLQQRLAARELDDLALEPLHLGDDVVDGHLAAAGEGVRRVAPAAPQVARGEPHEHARPADVRRLALDGDVDFVDRSTRVSDQVLEARSLKFRHTRTA